MGPGITHSDYSFALVRNIQFALLIYVMLLGLMLGNILSVKNENQCMIWVSISRFV